MTPGMEIVIYRVTDIAAAKQFYGMLFDVTPHQDEVYYVGFNGDGQEVGLDPNGHSKGMTGPVAYWRVNDINERLGRSSTGAETKQPKTDVGGGKLIATMKDADGNLIGLVQGPAAG